LSPSALDPPRFVVGERLARKTLVDREDSGLIDLFAIHKRGSEAPPPPDEAKVPSPALSGPPPAVSMDLLGPPASTSDLGDLDDENPFANQASKKKPVYYAIAGAGALLVIAIGIAAFSGGGEPAKPAPTTARQPISVTTDTPRPAPVQTAEPFAPATTTPAAPTTAAVAPAAKAPSAKAGAAWKPAPKKSWGPKLEKVQSTGVPSKS
jgi:hypothetical protein